MTNEKVKSNAVVTASWDKTVLTLAVKDAGIVTFDIANASPLLLERAAMHGFEQRLRDRAAIGRDPKTGASATPQDKFNRIKALADHYLAGGEWEMRGEGGKRKSEAEFILEALADIQGVELETMRERVTAAAEKREVTVDAYLKKVATAPAVAQKVAEIKFGDAAGADEMLGDLE